MKCRMPLTAKAVATAFAPRPGLLTPSLPRRSLTEVLLSLTLAKLARRAKYCLVKTNYESI